MALTAAAPQSLELVEQVERERGARQVDVEIALQPHDALHARERDARKPPLRALGETVRVPTLGGRVDLKLPKGSQADRPLRLKGRGLPGNPPGDQLVVLKVVVPQPPNAAEEALYRQLAAARPFNPRAGLEGTP